MMIGGGWCVDCIFVRRNENELTDDDKDGMFQCVCVCMNECMVISDGLPKINELRRH